MAELDELEKLISSRDKDPLPVGSLILKLLLGPKLEKARTAADKKTQEANELEGLLKLIKIKDLQSKIKGRKAKSQQQDQILEVLQKQIDQPPSPLEVIGTAGTAGKASGLAVTGGSLGPSGARLNLGQDPQVAKVADLFASVIPQEFDLVAGS